MEKLLIIDSNSLLNRAYYAMPPMKTTEGLHTNAIYGFTNMLLKIYGELKPDYVVAAFDRKAPTFRHKAYKDYKAGRKGMDDELAQQLQPTKDILTALGIPILEIDGYEADDLIGTLSYEAEQQGMECVILSGDRDNLQLASDLTHVIITKKGVSETEVYDGDTFFSEYGVTPTQFIDVKGLMGDKSDNIPGVPSIGEKTALQLIKDYGSIEGVYENLDAIKGSKQKQNLEDYMEDAFFSKKLATIMRNVPVELDFDELRNPQGFDNEKLRELFLRFQFRTLLSRLPEEVDVPKAEAVAFMEISDEAGMRHFQGILDDRDESQRLLLYFSFLDNTMLSKRQIETMYAVFKGQSFVIKADEVFQDQGAKAVLKEILEDESIRKIGYQVKNAYNVMKKNGIAFTKVEFDVQMAAYIIEPGRGQYSLKELISTYLFREMEGEGQGLALLMTAQLEDLAKYLSGEIEAAGAGELLYEVEQPLTNILSDMELEGFRIDRAVLDEAGMRMQSEIARTQSEVHELAGEEFNIASPKQLGVILFDKLDLPHGKRTKTGWSTNQAVLDNLRDKHPIVDKILYYRQITKIYSTYVEGLRNSIDSDGRIHSNFQQTLAVTGRLSSTEPNLQNIPIRYEMGRELRKAFIPNNEDSLIFASDYSQIELRVLAHIADDAKMQETFASGIDIHTMTAAEVFGKTPEEVTPRDRSNAKAVNFGIIYGIGDFALSQDLGISRGEAREYIDRYYDRYPSIRNYFDNTIKEAKAKGYTTTIMNRRRQIPEINASNKVVQAQGVRLAMNSPIQGSAADIIKVAMVKVYNALKENNLMSSIILQVHDEIIINMVKDEAEEVSKLVNQAMEHAMELKVTLKSEQSTGENWYEAK